MTPETLTEEEIDTELLRPVATTQDDDGDDADGDAGGADDDGDGDGSGADDGGADA